MNQSQITSFWKWVQQNAATLYLLREGHDQSFIEMNTLLREIHPELKAELSLSREGEREMILSAHGSEEAFALVTKLANFAPELPGFKVVPFCNKISNCFGLWIDGQYLETSQIQFVGVRSQKQWLLYFHVLNFKGSLSLCYSALEILLHHSLGEREFKRSIKNWKVHKTSAKSEVAHDFSELTHYINGV